MGCSNCSLEKVIETVNGWMRYLIALFKNLYFFRSILNDKSCSLCCESIWISYEKFTLFPRIICIYNKIQKQKIYMVYNFYHYIFWWTMYVRYAKRFSSNCRRRSCFILFWNGSIDTYKYLEYATTNCFHRIYQFLLFILKNITITKCIKIDFGLWYTCL